MTNFDVAQYKPIESKNALLQPIHTSDNIKRIRQLQRVWKNASIFHFQDKKLVYISVQIIKKAKVNKYINKWHYKQSFINLFIANYQMASISQLYSLSKGSTGGGVEGYIIQKKYVDPIKMRQQRILSTSKQKINSARPVNVSKKTTFIDQIKKIASKLPSPTSYDPKQYEGKSRMTDLKIPYADRKTIFDDLARFQKKRNFPGAGAYLKNSEIDKSKIRSNMSKAEVTSFLQSEMRNALQRPGVGNYNAYRSNLQKIGGKISPDQKNKSKRTLTQQKLPSVGTYSPNPVDYYLFESKSAIKKSIMNKQERFKQSKGKTVPFYNVQSEWGMKGKLNKKDILSKISNHNSRSVYY